MAEEYKIKLKMEFHIRKEYKIDGVSGWTTRDTRYDISSGLELFDRMSKLRSIANLQRVMVISIGRHDFDDLLVAHVAKPEGHEGYWWGDNFSISFRPPTSIEEIDQLAGAIWQEIMKQFYTEDGAPYRYEHKNYNRANREQPYWLKGKGGKRKKKPIVGVTSPSWE